LRQNEVRVQYCAKALELELWSRCCWRSEVQSRGGKPVCAAFEDAGEGLDEHVLHGWGAVVCGETGGPKHVALDLILNAELDELAGSAKVCGEVLVWGGTVREVEEDEVELYVLCSSI
jgi:hypothetical protein